MKRIFRTLMLLILPFFLWFGNVISANALVIGKEEKELLDMLGAEYELDANGNFVSFMVDQNSPRITNEIKEKIYNLYGEQAEIGNLRFVVGKSHHGTDLWGMEIRYYDDKGYDNILIHSDVSDIFMNPNGDFWNNYYDEDFSSDKPARYTKGTTVHTENGWNPYEEYQINGKGEYSLQYKRDNNYFYSYDKNGNLLRREDILEGIVYDGEGKPYSKLLNTTDTSGLFTEAPYEFADEIQQLIDENGGTMKTPEIQQMIVDAQMAQKLGLSLEDYRERYAVYDKLCTNNTCGTLCCLSLTAKANIFQVEPSKFWTDIKPPTEYDLPQSLSEKGIAEELTKLINNYRIENGLEPLADGAGLLQQVADIRAEECSYYMDSYHSRPLAGDASAFNVGENIANIYGISMGSTNEELAKILFEGWKNSSGHNANMLNETYQQGAIGIKFATIKGVLTVFASHDFSVSDDYDNNIPETVRKRIEIGAQTPENGMTTTEDYYRKYYGYEIPDTGSNSTEQEDADPNTSTTTSGSLQVLDENGNKFQLPNGLDWTNAWTDFFSYEGLWGPYGDAYTVTEGRILFSCSDGNVYGIYVYQECINAEDGSGDLIYFLNSYSGNTIMLKKCAYQTVDMVYPGGYNMPLASRDCYYIYNGDMVVMSF